MWCRIFVKTLTVLIFTNAIAVTSENTNDNNPIKELWHNYNLNEIWVHHGCDDILNQERPIHNKTTWKMLHQVYEDIVGKSNSSIHDEIADFDYLVNYDVRQTPDKGRSIFAKSPIPKGTTMYDFRRSAQFYDGPSYRNFLMTIRPDLACDVLMWAYLYNFEDGNGQYVIMVDLDDGSFCNDGFDKADAGWNKNGGWKSNYNRMPLIVSLRDISVGEEILCDYSEFSYDSADTYGMFGL